MLQHIIVGSDLRGRHVGTVAQKQIRDLGGKHHQDHEDQRRHQGRVLDGRVDGFAHAGEFPGPVIETGDGQEPLGDPEYREQRKHQHAPDDGVDGHARLPPEAEQYVIQQQVGYGGNGLP